MKVLRQIGFWASRRDEEPTLPDPRDFIDPSWDEREREFVAAYLRDGRRQYYSMGYSTCRLCGRSNGDATLADDAYQWPEGLAHYVEAHSVRLPAVFVAHVRRRLDRDEAVAVDRQWWCAQAPTGTERHWPEWRARVESVPPDRRAFVARELAYASGGSEPELIVELDARGSATATVAEEWNLAALKSSFAGCGVELIVEEREVPAPAELLG